MKYSDVAVTPNNGLGEVFVVKVSGVLTRVRLQASKKTRHRPS